MKTFADSFELTYSRMSELSGNGTKFVFPDSGECARTIANTPHWLRLWFVEEYKIKKKGGNECLEKKEIMKKI